MQAAKAKIEEIKRQKEIEKVELKIDNWNGLNLVMTNDIPSLAKEGTRRRTALQRKIAVANPKRQRRARTKSQSEHDWECPEH